MCGTVEWGRLTRCVLFLVLLICRTAYAALPDAAEFAWAVERNDIKQVRAWLDEGLNPEFQGKEIGTGLMIAAWYGHVPMMALFVERGANPRRSNRHGEQPLQLAAWNNHLEAVKWLLAHGATINRDGNYWSALHYSVFNGHSELSKYLISQGANINARSPNYSTPLMMAAREGHDDLAKTLIDAGADTRARNDWGDNALAFAMRNEHYKIGKMVSSPEEFAAAIKAPKESFGDAPRSAALPNEIQTLLRNIREAQAKGQPVDAMRVELIQKVMALRPGTTIVSNRDTPPPQQQEEMDSVVITAKRNQPGEEQARFVFFRAGDAEEPVPASATPKKSGAADKGAADKGAANKGAASKGATNKAATRPSQSAAVSQTQRAQSTFDQMADLMRQINLAEAQGKPADDLRRRLDQLIERTKRKK